MPDNSNTESKLNKNNTVSRFETGLKSAFPIPFLIAFFVDVIYGFFYYQQFSAGYFVDTSSYFNALKDIFNGRPDFFRTPVYPLFLHFCESIAPDMVNEVVILIQILIFYISIWFFYKLLSHFSVNAVFNTVGTILYGIMTPIIRYNNLMLTESLTISGIVIFAYFLVLFFEKKDYRYYTFCTLGALLLAMLRPSSIFLFVVIVIAAIPPVIDILKKKCRIKKRELIIPLAALLISFSALFGYMAAMKSNYGYFGISYITENDKFTQVVVADIWRDNPDTEIVDKLNSQISDGKIPLLAAYNIISDCVDAESDPGRLMKFSETSIKAHRREFAYYYLKKVFLMGCSSTEYHLTNESVTFRKDANPLMLWIGDLMDFNVNFVYFIFLMSIIGIIATANKRKQLSWPTVMITLLIGGQIGVIFLAGLPEFHRLNAPAYPFALLLVISWIGTAFDGIAGTKTRNDKSDPE